MNYAKEDRVTVDIFFPYFKQGDDFDGCKGDLQQFAAMHKRIAQKALDIWNAIPEEARPYISGDGCTHSCFLTGPSSVMKTLVDAGLAIKQDFDDEEYILYD